MHRVGTPDTAEFWTAFNGIVLENVDPERKTEPPEALYTAASGDLCHVVLDASELSPEAPGVGPKEFYDLARSCGGEGPWLRLVGVRNRLGPHGEPEQFRPECNANLGMMGLGYEAEQPASFNAVSGDGSEIFFTTDVHEAGGGAVTCTDPQLFVRLGGARSIEVSRPVDPLLPFGGCGEGGNSGEVPGEVPCPGATGRAPSYFKGASEDGSEVFFTTRETLVAGDTDTSDKLYVASIGCPASEPGCEAPQRRVTGLTDVSRTQSAALAGEDADVRGVVSMGSQAGHLYFVAAGVLDGEPNEEGSVAVKGADNLYSYDASTGKVGFVADLCSAAGRSGAHEDLRCPNDLPAGVNDTALWGEGSNRGLVGEAQSAGDGRYLVFASYGRLIEHGTQIDTDSARDIYRYDAQTGALDRVSVGEDGHDANGNGTGFDATIEGVGVTPGGGRDPVTAQQEMNARTISEDGSTILFRSTEPLSAGAVNHHRNFYLWHERVGGSALGEGSVSMVSTGSSTTDDSIAVITPSGRDVFFNTSQGLVPVDTENDNDVYDARIGGGFPSVAAERVQCSSDACQGALTSPAPLLVPGSVSQAAGQNYGGPSQKPKTQKPKKKKGRKARQGKGAGRTSSSRRTAGKASTGRGRR